MKPAGHAQPDRLVFWLDSPSPHQSSLLRSLSLEPCKYRVIGMFEQPVEPDRLKLGWRVPDFGNTRMIVGPGDHEIAEVARTSPESTVHVFGGLQLPMIRKAFPMVLSAGALVGLLSEARDLRGWRGKLRVLHSFLVERRHRDDIDFVLAIGALGMRWFADCGYAPEKLFPWGYFVERAEQQPARDSAQESIQGSIRVVYLGRCIPLKAIDDLIRALARQRDCDWHLSVIGDGPTRSAHEQLARDCGIEARVTFVGVVGNDRARAILANADVLVLPSLADGWGAVVNEALMAGVPVVCSDRCGAADLVRASGFGEVYAAGSVEQLAGALARRLAHGRVGAQARAEIVEWSRRVDGVTAAGYLQSIIAHVSGAGPRPIAPWLMK